MAGKLEGEVENVIHVQFPGADKRKVAKFAAVMAENMIGSPEEVRQKLLAAAPKLFQHNLSEQDVKSTIKMINHIYKENEYARASGEIGVETIGKLLKSTDEIFVSNYLKSGIILGEKSPLALLMYFSDGVADGMLKNRFSPGGILEWVKDIIEFTNEGKAQDLLLDYLYFDESICEDMDFSKYSIQTSAVFYEDIAPELESLVRLHYNRRLSVRKSVQGGAHTAEGDEINTFLPYYMDTREGNKMAYYILSDHEAGHIMYGSFKALLPAFLDYLKKELGKEITIRKIEFKDATGMSLKNVTYEYNGKTYFANSLLGFMAMFGDEYSDIVKDLWNCIEDGKDDAWWLDEKAYGMKNEYLEVEYAQSTCKGDARLDYSITGIRNAILMFVRGYAGSTSRDEFAKAVFSGETDALNEEEKKIVELIRKTDPKTLAFLEKYSNELVDIIMRRVYHTTPVVFLTFKIVNELKELVEKGEIEEPKEGEKGESEGRIPGTGVMEIDPKNISFEVGDESNPVPLNELPDDLKEDIEKKLMDFLNSLDLESRKELERRMGKEMKSERKDEVQFDRDFFVLEYDPALGRVSKSLQVPIHVRKAEDCASMADPEVVRRLSLIFRKLAQPREQTMHVEDGEEIDIGRRYEYILDKRAGIRRDKDYYVLKKLIEMRKVAIEIIEDASGSTSNHINGKRVIDYLTEATHSTLAGLSKVPAIKTGYSFYQSNGPVEGTTIYIGKHIDEKEVKYRKVEPGAANRDGAARRAGIERLLQRKEPVKILIFICDSLPADSDYDASVDDVRDARIEGEKKGIIQMTITTPVQESHFSSVPQCSTMEEYFDYMYGEDWHAITSQKDLIDAYENFFRSIIKKLKSTRLIV